jgi:tetratricopeptide (TPR) repeat protein
MERIRVNSERLLKLAESQFLNKEYKNALQSYGEILKDNPKMDEAKMGVYLSDLGLDSDDEAQALFDYYHTIKDSSEDAVQIINDIIESLDETKYSINQLISRQMDMQAEADGITYDDFLTLVKEKGNFKEVFENIMFSTKVVITSKEDLIDFIIKLSENGFRDMALSYLDDMSNIFPQDQEILELYKLFQKDKH